MKDQPRIILKDLIRRYGESVARDPSRCEGLLRDTCGTCTREIFVLVSAVRQHVPVDLLVPNHNLPLSLMKGFMIKRLQDELGLSDESARWAVETWAEALGLADPGNPEEPKTAPAGPAEAPVQEPLTGISPADLSLRMQWASDLESGELPAGLSAVAGLARSGDTESIRLLIGALENNRWKVRNAAFDALASLGRKAVPALAEALGDPGGQLVSRVVFVLAAIGDPGACEYLIPLLGRKRSLDLQVIFALGEIGDPRAVSPLSKYLVSPDQDIALAVAVALRKIAGK